MHDHLQKFLRQAENRFSEDSINMSMTEWIETNTSIKGKPFTIADHQFQRAIIDDMHPNMDVIKPSQVGLALATSTEINTARGWKTMGELIVGDKVYSEGGRVCNITYVSPIYWNRECYEVWFSDKSMLVADADHKWYVESEGASGHGQGSGEILRTKELLKDYKVEGRHTYAIPVTKPLQGKDEGIIIDPYYLGLWLGDGHSYSTELTCGKQDVDQIEKLLEARGLLCRRREDKRGNFQLKIDTCEEITDTMYKCLTKLNVIQNKHIPFNYLKASVETRFELLRGLIDSDGTVSKGGRVSFYNTNEKLAEQMQEIANSLGFKTTQRWKKPIGGRLKDGTYIRPTKPVSETSFTTYAEIRISWLPRKQSRLKKRREGLPTVTGRRRIVDIKRIKTVPVRCIMVDSPSHLYLAGRGMIPTHNTEAQIRKSLAFLIRNQGTSLIFSLPNEDMFKRISKARVKPIVDKDPVFTTDYDKTNKSVRSVDMMQFGHSFLYLVPAIESAATSINADVVMNDEVDLSDQNMITLFNSRLQGSKIAISQRFSTPTFPNFSIDSNFNSSDQHEYACRCSSCNHYNLPKFNRKFMNIPGLPLDMEEMHKIPQTMQDDLDLENAYVMCEKCGARLDLDNVDQRQWISRYPGRSNNSRGYRVTPFVTERLDPKYILTSLWRYKKTEFLRGFFNTVLGEAYSDGSIQLPRELIEKCLTEHAATLPVSDLDSVWVGIDMGQTCHIIIGKGPNVDNLHIVDMLSIHVDDLIPKVKEICTKYNVRAGAVDRHPYEPTAREVFHASGGKILPVEYRGTKEFNPILNEYKEVTHGQVDRTWFIDNFATLIRRQAIKISGYGYNREAYISHLRDMVRDESPDKPATWVKLTNNDHFFHASAFMALGPKIAEVLLLRDKQDTRLMTNISVVSMGKSGENLTGFHTGK